MQVGVTVLDDSAEDKLEGGDGRDWFFALLGDDDEDDIADETFNEALDLLPPLV